MWPFLGLLAGRVPVPVLQKVKVPFLAIFGGLDQNVVPSVNRPILEKALRDGGNPDYTIKVFPKGNHLMMESVTGGQKEYVRMSKTVDGYFETMVDWILERTRPSR